MKSYAFVNASILGFGLLLAACSANDTTGGTGQGVGAGGGSGAGAPCVVPSQVVYIGDSYINWQTHTFEADLEALAMADFRMYAEGGASMASGGIREYFIPQQFEIALMADPNIKFVIMDGGGNDLLLADSTIPGAKDCKDQQNAPTIPVCQQIVQMGIDKAIEGMQRMVQVGVKDVVYFFYPHLPEGQAAGSLAGAYPNVMLDYALPKVRETCESAAARTNGQLNCHFVDMVPVFQGHPEYFAMDGVHPNPAGSAAMAQAIWAKMQADCIGQPATSMCCTPGI